VDEAARRPIRLDDDDLIAGAQVLAWIALPHRPEHGVALLNHWYWSRRRFRGEAVPELPWTLKKQNRIEAQLPQFSKSLTTAWRAGLWFQRRCWAAIPPEIRRESAIAEAIGKLGASTRGQAERLAQRNGTEAANEIRAVWRHRRPVLHLARAVDDELGRLYMAGGEFDLERVVFCPDWLPGALQRAEELAISASRWGAFELSGFYRFHRDSF
jgi:hypothetical protein